MRRSILPFIIIISTALGLTAFVPSPGTLSSEERAGLIKCFFDRPYRYMFDEVDPASTASQQLGHGMYNAGINGIMDYGNLQDCLLDLGRDRGHEGSSSDRDEYLNGHFGALSGLSHAYQVKPDLPFKQMNPEFIRWAGANVIPEPQEEVFGLTAQQLYDGIFQRYFRLMAKSFLYLEKNELFASEWEAYSKIFSKDRETYQHALTWFENRYSGIPELAELDRYADGTAWTGGMSIGWWLRRHADGSSQACWEVLQAAMEKYDGEWITQAGQMLSAAERKALPVEACESCDCQVTVVYESHEAQNLAFFRKPKTPKAPTKMIPLQDGIAFLEISKIKSGWALVSKVYGEEFSHEATGKKDVWWVRLDGIYTGIRGYGRNGAPAFSSASGEQAINRFEGESSGLIHGCSGGWVLIQAKSIEGKDLKGWLSPEEQCPNPYTTCP